MQAIETIRDTFRRCRRERHPGPVGSAVAFQAVRDVTVLLEVVGEREVEEWGTCLMAVH